MLVTVFQPVTSENLPGQSSILSAFAETGPAGKIILGILLFFSFVSWVIIFAKFIRLRRVSRQSEKFVAFFRKSKRFSEVNTFAELAALKPAAIKKILDEAGVKIGDPGTWPQQARLAAEGKWEKLKTLQDSLKGGRKV